MTMQQHEIECRTRTSAARDIIDITPDVEAALASSGIKEGQVTVSVADAACALVVNERESGLWEDIARAIERIGPGPGGDGRTMGAASVMLPASAGRLRLGTWQRVLLIELEDGRERLVTIRIVGE